MAGLDDMPDVGPAKTFVHLPRAGDLGDTPRLKHVIVSIGPATPNDEDTLAESRCRYDAKALEFLNALYGSAPGGLIDAIFWQMARRQATILRVPHAWPQFAELDSLAKKETT